MYMFLHWPFVSGYTGSCTQVGCVLSQFNTHRCEIELEYYPKASFISHFLKCHLKRIVLSRQMQQKSSFLYCQCSLSAAVVRGDREAGASEIKGIITKSVMQYECLFSCFSGTHFQTNLLQPVQTPLL